MIATPNDLMQIEGNEKEIGRKVRKVSYSLKECDEMCSIELQHNNS
jgi:hypothetical protein